MSVFTRNDKPAETNKPFDTKPSEVTRPPETPSASATPVAKPTPAVAQPPLASTPASATPGVSVISKALKITGQLESTEDIRIDGEVDGLALGVTLDRHWQYASPCYAT